MKILAIDGSPMRSGRTQTVLDEVLVGCVEAGAEVQRLALAASDALDDVARVLDGVDAFVLGSPIYRGSFAWPLKAFLDRLPRGMWGETEAPITARAVAMVLTGASWHHYLALGDLRNVLSGFFAAHVLSPGLYVPADGFNEDGRLVPGYIELARAQGAALVALETAINGSLVLRSLRPQV